MAQLRHGHGEGPGGLERTAPPPRTGCWCGREPELLGRPKRRGLPRGPSSKWELGWLPPWFELGGSSGKPKTRGPHCGPSPKWEPGWLPPWFEPSRTVEEERAASWPFFKVGARLATTLVRAQRRARRLAEPWPRAAAPTSTKVASGGFGRSCRHQWERKVKRKNRSGGGRRRKRKKRKRKGKGWLPTVVSTRPIVGG